MICCAANVISFISDFLQIGRETKQQPKMWFCDGVCGIIEKFFVFIVAVVAVHYVYLLWNSDYWKKRGVFSPDPRALLGNLPGQITGKRSQMYEIDDLYKKYKSTHGYIGIFNFREPRLLVLDPEILKDIMIKYFKYFQGTEMYGIIDKQSDPLFGNHPFMLAGEAWKTKRAEVSPAFTNSRIKAIYPITQEVLAKMVNYIKQEIAKPDFDGLDAKDVSGSCDLTSKYKLKCTVYSCPPDIQSRSSRTRSTMWIQKVLKVKSRRF